MAGDMFHLPPHPMKAPPMKAMMSHERNVFHLRRRPAIPKKNSTDTTAPPRANIYFSGFWTSSTYPVDADEVTPVV